jgi:RNA 3'-terminal phosphate cyclase
VKNGAMSLLKRFILVDDGLELKIVRRGMPPGGGGEVHFRCPLRKLRPMQVSYTLYLLIVVMMLNLNLFVLR